MRKVNVLFFAADPLSISSDGSSPRLLLDEEVRRIRERVDAAVFGNMLKFDWRLAARVQDLQQALEETRPEIVHFSGHGGSGGLVLMGADGRTPRHVDAAVLRELFERDRGNIRLVVLTACHSLPQAEAIKEVVGCAIGTRDRISDDASIEFNAKFYSAIAAGRSVKDAFERARMALRLEYPDQAEILELLPRDDVDPAKLVLVSRFRRFARVGTTAALVLLSAAVIASWPTQIAETTFPPVRGVQLGDCGSGSTALPAAGAPAAAEEASTSASSGASATLAGAKDLCEAGNYEAAFPLFEQAAKAGSAEALGFVGIAYLTGEGTQPNPEHGIDLLREAAQKHDLRSMLALAVAYQVGYGVKQRSGRWAKYWLLKAATETGDAEAMRRLGVFYREERNDSALIWLQRADSAGSADARVDLGFMYDEGLMVPRDSAQAFRLYRSAAKEGSARGLFTMGSAYQEGFRVPRSYDSAVAYYRKAACARSGDAMNALGALYQQGLGVPEDRAKATRWFRLAEEAGSEVAAGNLETLRAPERPKKWKGPVARVLAWLGVSESKPELACAAS